MRTVLTEETIVGGRKRKADPVRLSDAPNLFANKNTNPAPRIINKRLIHPSER
jgi:hypothetical protein